MWIEALNLAGVPAASEWRRAKNIYYPSDLRKAPAALLGPRTDDALATTAPKQLSTTQAPFPPPEISKRSSKADDQGQGVEVAKGKKTGQVVLDQRVRAKVRKLNPCQRPNAQRLLPRQMRLLLRLLTLLSPNQPTKKTLIRPRLNLGPFSFLFPFFFYVTFFCYNSLPCLRCTSPLDQWKDIDFRFMASEPSFFSLLQYLSLIGCGSYSIFCWKVGLMKLIRMKTHILTKS